MAKGCLSGIEIADAVKRQREFQKLKIKALRRSGLVYTEDLGLWDRLRFWWLERQARIHIDDFDETPSDLGGPLNPNSYNLNLGNELLVYNVYRHPLYHNPPRIRPDAPSYLDVAKQNETRKLKIPNEGLVLEPGVLYLGRTRQHTESFNLRPCIDGRSSVGRLGIFIHATAGYGDIGFIGTWTLEIMVVHPVKIYPGMSIAQISYTPVSLRHRPYQSKKYQGQKGITASRLFMEFQNGEKKDAPADVHTDDVPGGGAQGSDPVQAAAK